MKLSVSLPASDVEFVDRYVAEHGERSRSAVLRRALKLLRERELGDAYEAAWEEWAQGDGKLWESTVGDGLHSEDWSHERGGTPEPAG
ncbi:MAG: ribbon-helix-helix protein, CopG family [Chloroflexi bacterium]|nr:ribbon-helix-helix protein, CopG family [Chloroflexota bacterium]